MTRSAARFVLVALLVLTVCPGRADASGWVLWDWLDQLSGPGPFHGLHVAVPLVCGLGQQENGRVVNPEFKDGITCLNPRRMLRSLDAEREAGDLTHRPWRRTVTLHLNLARLSSSTGTRNLQYVEPPAEPGVNWFRIGPGFVWHVHQYLDVHAGLDLNRLSSKGDLFEPIWVPTVELVGVTLHPFADARNRHLRGVSFSVRTARLMRSLDAGEFGAIRGSFQTGKETLIRFGIAYDFWGLR
jgi:hypothetical protein